MTPSQQNLIAFVSINSWSIYNFRLDIIKCFQEMGYAVLVIAPEDGYSRKLAEEGCLFEHVIFNNRSANPVNDLDFYRQLKRIYAKHSPVLVFHYVAKPNIYGSLAAGALGIPSIAVVTGLGYAFDRKNWLYFLIKKMYWFSLKKAKEVWFLNQEDAALFAASGIVPSVKIKTLPGEGVNTGYFSRSVPAAPEARQEFVFLMTSRLLKKKGISLYAEAAGILRKKSYLFRCLLMGNLEKDHPDVISPDELNSWQKAGLLEYLGFAADVRPYLENADCSVLPSYYNEGVPRSLMEAASMELPLITSDNRGCRELVDNNITGFLCKSRDAEDLAASMEKMMNLPIAERLEMGRRGRRLMVQKFDISKVIAVYIAAVNRYTPKPVN
jgi:glycosyltransferase involved in cell wall biosynthesis